MSKEIEVGQAFEKWDEDELNDAELAYYIEVTTRIQKRLIELAA